MPDLELERLDNLYGSMFCAESFGNDLWASFSNSPNTSVHKIGAQRGARGVKNTHRGVLGGYQPAKDRDRTYDRDRKCSNNYPCMSWLLLRLYEEGSKIAEIRIEPLGGPTTLGHGRPAGQAATAERLDQLGKDPTMHS